jgi:hypothetical protein
MSNPDFGRCDGHHKMVDCIGLDQASYCTRELEKKRKPAKFGRSAFASPVARTGPALDSSLNNGRPRRCYPTGRDAIVVVGRIADCHAGRFPPAQAHRDAEG